MTIISDGTFAECTGLTSITIPKSVKLINNDAFRRCTGLTSIYCLGTKEEYAKIKIGLENDAVRKGRYYYSEEKPARRGFYWHYVDGVPTKW